MTDDLIKHVRDWLDADGQNWGDHEKGIAAMFDHIEAQAAEIARLKGANQAAAECVAAMMEECARYRDEIRAALQETKP